LTGSEDVIARFSRSQQAAARLRRWKLDVSKRRVVPWVLAHVTRVVDCIRPGDVLRISNSIAADRSRHALGQIKKADIEKIIEVRDWHPDFAFTHLMHFVIEDTGELPTFDEFIRHRIFKDALYDDIRRQVARAGRGAGQTEALAKAAVRWRIGNAYYSFLKEQYVISVMRSEGVDVRQHPLADALFRVDCWAAETNIDLYVRNKIFRSGDGNAGRKTRSGNLLSDTVPPFKNIVLEFAPRHTFGDVHLPDAGEVRRACKALLSEGAAHS